MSQSDWEPLPPDQIGRHPGEDADLARLRAVIAAGDQHLPPAQVPADPGLPERPADSGEAASPAAEPEAARSEAGNLAAAAAGDRPPATTDELRQHHAALAAIQQRLAAAGPSKSLVSAVERRAVRERRRRYAAQREDLRAVEVQDVAPRKPNELPLPVAYAAGREGRDPREEAPWFAELPRSEQARLHDVWAGQRERQRRSACPRPDRSLRAFAAAFLVAGVIGLLCTPVGLSFGRVGALAGLGGIAGLVAHHAHGGRFGYAIAGVCAFMVGMGSSLLTSPFVMIAGLMFAYGFGVLGMEQEMRRSGGFDVEQEPPPEAGLTPDAGHSVVGSENDGQDAPSASPASPAPSRIVGPATRGR